MNCFCFLSVYCDLLLFSFLNVFFLDVYRELYPAIEAVIKNLMTSLRAVTDLQNPAIKDRHWLELMMATKVFKVYLESSHTG